MPWPVNGAADDSPWPCPQSRFPARTHWAYVTTRGHPRSGSRASSHRLRSALEQDVVGRVALRLARPGRGVAPRLDDQLVAGLEDDGLLVGDVDAHARERVLVGATLADAPLERAETLDGDLAAGAQQVAHRIEHGVQHPRRRAPRDIELLRDLVGEDALVGLPAEGVLASRLVVARRLVIHAADVGRRILLRDSGHPIPSFPVDPVFAGASRPNNPSSPRVPV